MSEVTRYRADKIPEKITRKLFIFARKYSGETEYSITLGDADYSKYSDSYILLGTEKITFSVPQTYLFSAAITDLCERREQIRAEAERSEKTINERIQALLSSGGAAD